jgi:hypothetical protein
VTQTKKASERGVNFSRTITNALLSFITQTHL